MASNDGAPGLAPSESNLMQGNIDDAERRQARIGVVYGVAAFGWWGLCAIYFKAVAHVPALQVLAHRVVWSLLFLIALVWFQQNWAVMARTWRDRRTLARLGLTTVLIGNNWGLFIWAVANDRLLEASLGYFINPLVNVLLGFVFLRERLRRMQGISVVLASVGVAFMIVCHGQLPWIALVLAFSFGFYGLIRKTADVPPLIGLTVETALMLPVALVYLIVQQFRGTGAFGSDSATSLLLTAAGIITAVPLLWFVAAAKRLRYVTMGFIQYLAPTGQFLLAVLAYGETFTRDHLITFAFIWAALVLYSIDAVMQPRRAWKT